MALTIKLKDDTRMVRPGQGPGRPAKARTFPKGSPVFYNRTKRSDGQILHKVSAMFEGDLYEHNVLAAPGSDKHDPVPE